MVTRLLVPGRIFYNPVHSPFRTMASSHQLWFKPSMSRDYRLLQKVWKMKDIKQGDLVVF